MSSPVFERLSMASVDFLNAKDGSMDRFAESTDRIATLVEAFFHPEPVEAPPENPSLIGRVMRWFSHPPTARAVTGREVEASAPEASAVNAIVSEAKTVIVGKLLNYSREGEGRTVPLDRVAKSSVLRYLKEMIHGVEEGIFGKSLNRLITTLEAINVEDNKLDWDKMLRIVRSLHRITNHE